MSKRTSWAKRIIIAVILTVAIIVTVGIYNRFKRD